MVDGVSLVPLLNGQGTLEDRALFWHHPHYHHTAPGGAGRQGILDAWRKSVDAQMLNANPDHDPAKAGFLSQVGGESTPACRMEGGQSATKMKTSTPTYVTKAIFLVLALALPAVSAMAGETYSPYADHSYPTNVYWGDTHVHTALSGDAFALGARLMPDDAYRFAKGETVRASGGEEVRLRRPLDFLMVADHAENLGVLPRLAAGDGSVPAMQRYGRLRTHEKRYSVRCVAGKSMRLPGRA